MTSPRAANVRRWVGVLLIGCVVAGVVLAGQRLRSHRKEVSSVEAAGARANAGAGAPAFVGEAVCVSCHAQEAARWKGSHHQLAMQVASPQNALGDFDHVTFAASGVSSKLFRRDGKLVVRTDGAGGALEDFEITHAFGVSPLQQYLVAFPKGRSQALAIAWDSRPRREGGQRWFHLYPNEKITSHDELHWTGPAERWNFMCADCHSTNVRKSYDEQTDTYATTFAAISVSCEACHGPGSAHVAWAHKVPCSARVVASTKVSDDGDCRRDEASHGLLIALDERRGVSWTRDPATHQPHRSVPRRSEREIEMCARCHSRRGLVHEDHVHGQPVGDDYRVALLDEDLYYPDGQIKGEVYEYGSFTQSRMFAEGVTCSDCHDPHRPDVRVAGDNLCLQCHAAQTYAAVSHHFHPVESPAGRCVACHMPTTTYMVVDRRHDHSLRVPRPDLSVELGVPNACNGCHTDRSAAWAAHTVERWYGHTPSGRQQFAQALAAGSRGAPGAQSLLAALVIDRGQPAIARASALVRMEHQVTQETLNVVRGALDDPSALVRRAAVQALADVDPRVRGALVSPLLADDVRTVRTEAALAIAGVPAESMTEHDLAARERATTEFVAAQKLSSDRPEGHLGLAALYAKQQLFDQAESELKRALAIDPAFVPAAVNLAALYGTVGRDAAAEPILRAALGHAPNHPALLHALGLAMVREKRTRESLGWLAEAARRGPDNPRYGFVYAVALHDDGWKRDALKELEGVLEHHPYDRDSLAALATYLREAGDLRQAQRYSERLQGLAP